MYWKKKQCSITSALYREKCSIIVELAVLERYILLVVSVTNIPGLIIEYPDNVLVPKFLLNFVKSETEMHSQDFISIAFGRNEPVFLRNSLFGLPNLC
ncbi:hypothetical protein NC651_021284 [Populus alba x Populus x berolinensis]|nr:hypothetical protein NC651_021284 [Populus alba x Populus x berolinensis]